MNHRSESRSTILGGFFYCLTLLGTSACAPSSPALVQTLNVAGKQIFTSDDSFQSAALRLDPQWQYLRVQLNDGPSNIFVLGHVDANPHGAVEVWYSAKAEVLKLQEGRIVGTHGLAWDWTKVRLDPAPKPWETMGSESTVSKRFHDELPSYRFGVVDTVQTQAWQALPSPRWAVPQEVLQLSDLRWYRESAQVAGAGTSTVSWFARGSHLGSPAIVYSEQCLSATHCFRLQRLPMPEGHL